VADLILVAPRVDARPAIRWRTLLEGAWYGFRMAYNTRMQGWYLDVEGDDGTLLVAGLRVAVGTNLLRPFGDDRLPPGQLYAIDVEGQDRDPGRYGLSGPIQLRYRTAADALAAAGTATEVL
jgi:uncharacterized protein DUF6983